MSEPKMPVDLPQAYVGNTNANLEQGKPGQNVAADAAQRQSDDLGFLDHNAPQPNADLQQTSQKVTWVFWVYVCIAAFTLVELGINSATVESVSDDPNGTISWDFGSVKLLLAASVMTIFGVSYGIAFERRVQWIMDHTDFRYSWQLAACNAVLVVFWFAGGVAHAKFLGQITYCNPESGWCDYLASNSRHSSTVLVVFAFFICALFIPLTKISVTDTWRRYQVRPQAGQQMQERQV